ncbi:MAG: alpha/beta fold hydrolase [Nocardioidaceae bacterium]
MACDETDLVLELPDGRAVCVWTGGDPDGAPILYHHVTPAGRLQARIGHHAARRRGVRLISFNRPGYGGSAMSAPGLASVGADTLAVADLVGVGKFGVLGVSGGGPFALATGLADPARVRAVGVAAGIGPWRTIEPPDFEPDEREILRLVDGGDVEGAVSAYVEQGSLAFGRMLHLDDAAMVEEFFSSDATADRGWLDDAAKVQLAAALRDGLQTLDGFARDNVSWGGDWDIDVAGLTVPTWLWYGVEDQMVPPYHGRWLARRISDATFVLRGSRSHGGTIFGYWDDMLVTLRDQILDDTIPRSFRAQRPPRPPDIGR